MLNFTRKFNTLEPCFTVGIIAGTPFDAKLGAQAVQEIGCNALQHPISGSPELQTLMQVDSQLLTNKVSSAIDSLIKNGANSILIYCNSISVTVDLAFLRGKYGLPIFSPADILNRLQVEKESTVGLIAANCQSIGKTEAIVIKNNPTCSVIGLGFLPLISMVEQEFSPDRIIKKSGLLELFNFLIKNQCDELILGCTHFAYLQSELKKLIRDHQLPIRLIPIFELLLQEIKVTLWDSQLSSIPNHCCQ